MTADTHVVFGTGPAGRAVAGALVDQGARVRMVNRSGKAVVSGVETIGGDATDPAFARHAAADADTVYFCLNAPNYHRWAEEFPPLQRAVVGAATVAQAKLVVLENLYLYGSTVGPLRETTPINPTSCKSRTRATMSAELLEAHRRGDVRVVIGRSSDFIGPGVRDSAFGEFVFEPALGGKRAQTMGRPDTLHTYSYVPDVGRNLVLLGSHDDAYGRAWHLPNPVTRTTRQIIIDVYAETGRSRTSVTALKLPMLRAFGLFNRNVRELRHTYYQFAAPFIVDDSAIRDTFGGYTTSWDEIVTTTVDWYRAQTKHASSRQAPRRGPNPEGAVMMSSLASVVVRRRRMVITIWFVVLIAAGTIGSSAFSVLSSSFGAGPSTESGRVTQRLDDLAETGGEIAIIADDIDIDDPGVAATIGAGLERIAAIDGVIAVVDPWSTGAAALRAGDGRAALAVVTITGGLDEETELELTHQIADVARDIDAPEVLVGGNVLVGEQFGTASENDLLRGEAIARPIAFLAMIFLLGGLRAAGMPMLVALAGVVTSLAVLVAATQIGDVSIFSINVVNMLGIGLGIDYGLLMVSRFREERGRGRELHDAVVQTVATAGKTVVFSALTVAVAMCGLFVFGLPILSSFGIAGLGVVLVCMAAAVTLLPAVLAAVGGKIPPTAPAADVAGRFYRLTRWVQSHAVAVGAGAIAFLVLLGVPFLGARFEIGDARTLPRSSEVRDVALTLADRFPARGTDPVTVIADSEADSTEFLVWYEQLSTTPRVAGTAIRPDSPPGLTVVDVTPTGTSQGAEASELVAHLRGTQPTFDTEVGGIAAELIDIKTRLSERLPYAALMVIVATLALLFLMTGSIIVPIKAVVMNILSLCASFGALVWIFQDGHLAGFFNFDSVGALDLWMPVLILIFAFGLSMDYEVFLLSRIKEVHDETGDNDLAVAVGLQRSGRIITSAAVLIVIVFAGFAAGEVLAIKQLGVGLAIAVLVDATLVRMLLVPATMKLLGERNWWAPAPLRRFHERFGLHEAPSHPTAAGIGLSQSTASTEPHVEGEPVGAGSR